MYDVKLCENISNKIKAKRVLEKVVCEAEKELPFILNSTTNNDTELICIILDLCYQVCRSCYIVLMPYFEVKSLKYLISFIWDIVYFLLFMQ